MVDQQELGPQALLPPFVTQGDTKALPRGPLRRMAQGLQSLGQLHTPPPPEGAAGVPPGVLGAQLWGNPLLPGLPQAQLAVVPGMDSVGGLLSWWQGMQPWLVAPPGLLPGVQQHRYEAWLRARLARWMGGGLAEAAEAGFARL